MYTVVRTGWFSSGDEIWKSACNATVDLLDGGVLPNDYPYTRQSIDGNDTSMFFIYRYISENISTYRIDILFSIYQKYINIIAAIYISI